MKHDRRQEKSDKTKLTVRILIGVIVALVLVIGFFFVAQPQMEKYDNNRWMEGAQMYVEGNLLPQLQANNGFAQLPVGNDTIILAYVTEEEAQFLQQVRAQQEQTVAQSETAQ